MDFLSRALQEAARYGSDPWIFVRELLQNARDAAAARAAFLAEETGGISRISCRDDGAGMTFDHARRYLFTLYASSKEGSADQAGRFGVGFWSVLRFRPERIVIRSWPHRGEPWEVTLDGGLTRASRGKPATEGRGTEVVLERAGVDGQLARRVTDAARQNARFLATKDDARKPLAVTVNGKSVNERFALPAPSASFRRGRIRGVVALGKQSRVELFSKGLRVRSAAFLDDLLSPASPHAGSSRVRFPELAEAFSPQALLENGDLELLLSRSDARDGRSLRKTVLLAQKELARLVERQLAFSRPDAWWRRLAPPALAVAAIAVVFLIAAAIGVRIGGPRFTGAPSTPPSGGIGDLSRAYHGPQVDALQRGAATPSIRYEPAVDLHIAGLVVPSLDGAGRTEARNAVAGEYRGTRCLDGCVSFEMDVVTGAGLFRIPVPTGHRLDVDTVTLGDRRVRVVATGSDEPALSLDAPTRATLRYRTVAGSPPVRTVAVSTRDRLPDDVQALVRSLRRKPARQRVADALAWTRRSIAYANDADTIARHRAAAALGTPFVERTLDIGAGDCDVQNGVLARVLAEAGIPARLVVGWLGNDGAVSPFLHAWVEVRIGDGPWQTVDASEGSSPIVLDAPVRETGATPLATPQIAVAAPDVASSAPATASSPRTRAPFPVWPLAGATGAFACIAAGLVLSISRRTQRSVALDRAHDIARLLTGAIEHPNAFQHVPSLFRRRLVPCVGRAPISLADAWQLAATARLYRSAGRQPLADEIARAGGRVVDTGTDEGRAVGGALGAIDLDTWATVLAQTVTTPLLDAVNACLAGRREDWRVKARVSARGVHVLDMPSRGGIARVVVVDAHDAKLAAIATRLAREPASALFEAMDELCDASRLPADRRSALLTPLARAAILEAGRA